MAEGAAANTVNWGGHAFYVLSMEADWNDEPGVYIFAGIQADALWHAYYVGITESFKARLQDHEHWFAACRLGASHVHALVVPLQAERQRSEEHTSELQSQSNLVCRLLLEKKKTRVSTT